MRTVELHIENIAFGGKGIGRDNGKTVFVPFTIGGETVSAKIVREKKQFAEGEVLNVLDRSPHRVDPPCPYFGRCGGCAYQHLDYEHQLTTKSRQVNEVLQRIGKLKNISVNAILPSPAHYGYRNRITVHAENGVVGYFRRDSHRLIDVDRCPIADEEVNRELEQLRAAKPRDGHYKLRAGKGPRVFSQTNNAVADALRDLVVKLIPDGEDLLIDAYCGAGFFAKALLEKFQRVIGIDWDRFAIDAANKNASSKETYIAGDVEEQLTRVNLTGQDLKPRTGMSQTTLIVDPPATGLSDTIRRTIFDLAPDTFIYVSCNPATLARDLSQLQSAFDIDSVTPLDMFPQTAEIEAVAYLRRIGASAN